MPVLQRLWDLSPPLSGVLPIPFLTEEMESTLRRLAWKDEDFRDALLADPKGIIQQVFPHCFPEGKLPDDLTINVVEQDPFTRHIVFPAFADEEPTLEIPEEDQLDLIINLGDLGMARDSYDARMRAQSTGERKPDLFEAQFKRDQAKGMSNGQGDTKESLLKRDAKFQRSGELDQAISKALQDKEIRQAVREAKRTDGNFNGVIQMIQEKGYLKGVDVKLYQDTRDTLHMVLPKAPDDFGDYGIPEDIHENKNRRHNATESGCSQFPQCASALSCCCMN